MPSSRLHLTSDYRTAEKIVGKIAVDILFTFIYEMTQAYHEKVKLRAVWAITTRTVRKATYYYMHNKNKSRVNTSKWLLVQELFEL